MFFAYAFVNSVTPSNQSVGSTVAPSTNLTVTTPTPPPSISDSLYDYDPGKLAVMGSYSLLLTLVNILIIFIMGVIILMVIRFLHHLRLIQLFHFALLFFGLSLVNC